MADELTPSQSEPVPTAVTAEPPARPGPVAPAELTARTGEGGERSELSLLLGWCAGLALVVVCGWGLIWLAFYLARQLRTGPELPVAGAAMLSLGLFLVLERAFWLSRLMGLQIGPGAAPWQSALLHWLFGVPGLLFRSTAPPAPQAKGAAGEDGRAAEEEKVPPVPLASWLLNLGAQLAFGAGVGALFLLFLWSSGTKPKSAMGTAALIALAATFVARSLIRWPLPKSAFARPVHYPPGVRPSDTGGREVVETVVFVVVLVLLLKSFAAEAFVIPTGSMAETLYGYQKEVDCPSCGITFPVNCSNEVDPQEGNPKVPVNGCTCPNCRQVIRLVDPELVGRGPRPGTLPDGTREVLDPGWGSGDRVLVGKFFDALARTRSPRRLDVVVFKYPEGPQKSHVAMNYIKRLVGLPGETIVICGGDLYVLPPGKGPTYDDSHVPPKDLWQKQHTHESDEEAKRIFRETGRFEIVRKPPEVLLAMMRLVYDNDHQAADLKGKEWQRWQPDADAWEAANGNAFRHGTRVGEGWSWLRYRHLLRDHGGRPSLVTDFMGYNSGESLGWDPLLGRWQSIPRTEASRNGVNWVGDLIVECEVQVEKAEGEFALEVVRGGHRYRATWDLASGDGTCTLTRAPIGGGEEVKLDSRPTKLRRGTYRVRLANVDQRLTVWVDRELPFGDGVAYAAPGEKPAGPTLNDFQPASVGVKGAAATVRGLKLFRDTYYTIAPNREDADVSSWVMPDDGRRVDDWDKLHKPPALSIYVQPGHYLCLGDNSPQSSDGRTWGLVPERLLLGRALLVYYPFDRAGRIR